MRFMSNVAGLGLLDGENVHTLLETVYQAKNVTRARQADVKVIFPDCFLCFSRNNGLAD